MKEIDIDKIAFVRLHDNEGHCLLLHQCPICCGTGPVYYAFHALYPDGSGDHSVGCAHCHIKTESRNTPGDAADLWNDFFMKVRGDEKY